MAPLKVGPRKLSHGPAEEVFLMLHLPCGQPHTSSSLKSCAKSSIGHWCWSRGLGGVEFWWIMSCWHGLWTVVRRSCLLGTFLCLLLQRFTLEARYLEFQQRLCCLSGHVALQVVCLNRQFSTRSQSHTLSRWLPWRLREATKDYYSSVCVCVCGSYYRDHTGLLKWTGS